MHLWQIRQFPNEPQNQPDRQVLRGLLILVALGVAFGLTAGPAAAQEKPEPPAASAETEKNSAAEEYFQKALAANRARQSVQATLLELVQISDQPLRMTGRYLEQGRKTRLELSVKLTGGNAGSLLEVSDGDTLWSETELGVAKQVTLRNLKQIAAAVEDQPAGSESSGPMELGLGGLSGLLSSLERTMQFDQLREEMDGETKLVILQGKWKPDYAAQWRKKPADNLPTYVPDLLRIYFDAETLFPRQLLYLKRNAEKKSNRPLVRLEFQDVQLDETVDDSLFQYTPPEDLVPDDITPQYIEQLKRRNAPPGEAKPTEKPAEKPAVKPAAK